MDKLKNQFALSFPEIEVGIVIDESNRAVGTAMAQNPFSIIFPCHRVVRSDGKIGAFGGEI